jgi:hypothetical protein
MPDWSIKIIPGANPWDPAVFAVDRNGVAPGAPLVAGANDLVSWNNTTDDEHQPWPAKADYSPLPQPLPNATPDPNNSRDSPYYLSDPIPPKSSSRPTWQVVTLVFGTDNTFYYTCLNDPRMRGRVVLSQ